jgi:hypothetical protein
MEERDREQEVMSHRLPERERESATGWMDGKAINLVFN